MRHGYLRNERHYYKIIPKTKLTDNPMQIAWSRHSSFIIRHRGFLSPDPTNGLVDYINKYFPEISTSSSPNLET